MNHNTMHLIISGVMARTVTQHHDKVAYLSGNKLTPPGFWAIVVMVLGMILGNIILSSIFNLTIVGMELAWNKLTGKNNG